MSDYVLPSTDSLVDKMNPKIRILSAAWLSVACALCRETQTALGFLGISLALLALGKIPLSLIKKRLFPLVAFLAMIWLFLPLTFGGEALGCREIFGYPICLSREGIRVSLDVSVKSCAILLCFTALLATLPIQALGNGLQQLRVPEKFIFLLLMSFRYIHVIKEEYDRLLRAARFRGFTPGTNVHSYKTYAYLTGMLFVRASLRAGRVHQAMQCRGFNGRFHTLDTYAPHPANVWFLTLSLVAGLGLIYLDVIVL